MDVANALHALSSRAVEAVALTLLSFLLLAVGRTADVYRKKSLEECV